MLSGFTKKFLVLIPIIIAVALGIAFSFPAEAQECSYNNCVEINYEETKYRLKGESYHAYYNLINRDIPYKSMQLQTPFLNATTPFLMAVDGNSSEVDKIRETYDFDIIIFEDVPQNPDYKQFRGYVEKKDLTKILSAYPTQVQNDKAVTIYHVNSLENNLGKFDQTLFLTSDQKNEIIADIKNYKHGQILKIINEKEGVSIAPKK